MSHSTTTWESLRYLFKPKTGDGTVRGSGRRTTQKQLDCRHLPRSQRRLFGLKKSSPLPHWHPSYPLKEEMEAAWERESKNLMAWEERMIETKRMIGMKMLDYERDPNGKNQHDPGAKMDHGKPNLDLVLGGFARALLEVGKVGTYGANKYTPLGWVDVPDGEQRYQSALLRHYFAYKTGEEYDKETSLLHEAHAAWNALAKLELKLRRLEYEEDQRMFYPFGGVNPCK